MKNIAEALKDLKQVKRPTNLYTEFQEYGVWLAEQLGDPKHYSLYIKLSKECPRGLIDEALSYTKGYTNAKSRAKIFMWKLKQLRLSAKS